jgi:hypothetical protein
MQKSLLAICVVFLLSFFFSVSPAFAATYFVNADSDGSAGNPTRSFNDSSYSANDSFKSFSAAYSVAGEGDTIELSGGTNGKTYIGHSGSLQKNNLSIIGSSQSGHNGTVIIDSNPNSDHTLGMNANGMTLQNVTLHRTTGTTSQFTLRVYKNTAAVKNVTIANSKGFGINIESSANNPVFENLRVETPSIGGANAMNAYKGFTMTNSIFFGLKTGGIAGISFQQNSGTSTLNNVVFDQIASGAIKIASGSTVNLTNCVITSPGFSYGRSIIFASPGTLNTTNCFIQGPVKSPHGIINGTGTWNSTNDIINEYSYFTRTKENMGYIFLEIDDRHNIDHFKTIADYAKTHYGMKLSFYVHDTENLTASNKTKLQQLYLDGHEIALHGQHHTNMGVAGPMTVTYTGTATNMAVVVSNNATTLSVTGSADTHGPLNLTAAANDTVGELCSIIESWARFTCTLTGDSAGPTKDFIPSYTLKDASTTLARNVATTILYDDNPGPGNRFMTEEVTDAKNELEAAMHENPLTAEYKVETFGYPYSQRTDFTTNWMKNNTNFSNVRSVSLDSIHEKTLLENINLYKFHSSYGTLEIRGTGYNQLSTQAKKLRIQQSARAMVTFASQGVVTGYVGHNEGQDLSAEEWMWLIDEIAIYAPVANVQVTTHSDAVNTIKTSGDWTDQGDGFWKRIFTGQADFTPRAESLMVDAGVALAGRVSDILGNALAGIPDIGAFERTSSTPVISPPTTTLSGVDGNWHNTNVTATFNCVPAPEHTCAVTYYTVDGSNPTTESSQGTSVELSTDGVHTLKYFSVDNEGRQEAIKTSPNTIKIDKTAPTFPGTPATTSPATDATPTWSWTPATDEGSGLANPAYTVEWSTTADFSANVRNSTTNTATFTHSGELEDGTWYIRIKAADAAANQSSYSENGTITIDTEVPVQGPTAPSYVEPANEAINQKLDVGLNWSASTSQVGGPVTYDVFLGENPSSLELKSANQTSLYYMTNYQDTKTYYWQIVAKDTQGNATPGPVQSFSTYKRIATPDNLAKNKPIFSSNAVASGLATYINDGMKFSDGARAFDTMEAVRTNTLTGQVSIDLGESYTVNSMVFQVEDNDSYKVQTSANGTSWTTYGNPTPITNTTPQTTYQTHTITANRSGVRYIRVVPVSGNYIFRMSEIEVYQ